MMDLRIMYMDEMVGGSFFLYSLCLVCLCESDLLTKQISHSAVLRKWKLTDVQKLR